MAYFTEHERIQQGFHEAHGAKPERPSFIAWIMIAAVAVIIAGFATHGTIDTTPYAPAPSSHAQDEANVP